MNLSSPLVKTIVAIIVVSTIGFFAYSYLSGGSSSAGDLTQVSQTATSKMGAQVLSALNQLRQLQLDTSVFSNATFKSLKDFSQPLPTDQIPGRDNPFAPIGTNVSKTVSTSVSPAAPVSASSSKPAAKTVSQ